MGNAISKLAAEAARKLGMKVILHGLSHPNDKCTLRTYVLALTRANVYVLIDPTGCVRSCSKQWAKDQIRAGLASLGLANN